MEKTNYKSEIKVFLFLSMISVLVTWGLVYCHNANQRPATIQTTQIDSLNSLVMELQIEKGRYEIIIDNIRAKDSMIVIEAMKNLE